MNHADMAMEGFSCYEGRQIVTDCSPAVFYTPLFFFTRHPLPATKMWNFVELFEPLVWGLVFLSIFYFFIFIKVCNVAVRKIENLGTITEWFLLFPFGYVLNALKFKISQIDFRMLLKDTFCFWDFKWQKIFQKYASNEVNKTKSLLDAIFLSLILLSLMLLSMMLLSLMLLSLMLLSLMLLSLMFCN